MEELRALLDAQEEERELVEEHARRMFNLTARTVVSLQQQKEARIAVERAKSCLKLPKTHTDATQRAFHPEAQTYSEWNKDWDTWVHSLHPNQRRMVFFL